MLETQAIFTKRVLQVISVLHNKEASLLAKRSIELLNKNATTKKKSRLLLWTIATVCYYQKKTVKNKFCISQQTFVYIAKKKARCAVHAFFVAHNKRSWFFSNYFMYIIQ